jgi:hypothetical protein
MTKRNQNGRRGNGPYRYTAKRKAALTRAQAISARKRKRNKNIATGVIAGATLAGIGATAIYGYKNRKEIQITSRRWKNAVQPGSKERVRLANALSGNLVKKPSSKTGATRGAKTMTRTQIEAVHPDLIDPSRNDAFPKRGADAKFAADKAKNADRAYNVDKFLPKGVKGLIYGKQVTGEAAGRAIQTHVEAKGKITGESVDGSAILHDMIADGTAKKVYAGRRRRGKGKTKSGVTPPVIPKSGRAGRTARPAAPQNLESKAFDQWIADFEP